MKKALVSSAAGLLLSNVLGFAADPLPTLQPTLTDPPVIESVVYASDCGAPSPRAVFSAEYLLWSIKNSQRQLPLLTTGPGVDPATSGVLGQPGTSVLLDAQDIEQDAFSGMRIGGENWNADGNAAVEVRGFFLEHRTFIFAPSSNAAGAPQIAIPYFDANPIFGTGESYVDVAFPGFAAGRVDVSLSSRLWGLEANGLFNVSRGEGGRFDLIAGFRYADLMESFVMDERYAIIPTSPDTGAFLDQDSDGPFHVVDAFRTRNQFYGGQVGARANLEFNRLLLGATFKLALGQTRESVTIQGQTTSADPNAAGTAAGGVFAVPSNIGRHTNKHFAVIPEVELKVGYQLTDWLAATVGYNFMYWSSVVRPLDQIDRVVNGGQQPTYAPVGGFGTGPAVPSFNSNRSDFWAQGLSFGLVFKY
jgi:hypothetical protein